jgi:hypothetical protein
MQPETGRDGCREACMVRSPHCITSVTVNDVLSALQQMLNTGATLAPGPTKPRVGSPSDHLLRVHAADAMWLALDKMKKAVERPTP